MQRRARLVLAGLLLAAASTASAGEVKLAFSNGLVTLVAVDASPRQILTEWARLGQVRVTNLERLAGGPVTLQLSAVPETQALEVLLRGIAGYVAAPRPAGTRQATVARYDRILIMPGTAPPVSKGGAALPQNLPSGRGRVNLPTFEPVNDEFGMPTMPSVPQSRDAQPPGGGPPTPGRPVPPGQVLAPGQFVSPGLLPSQGAAGQPAGSRQGPAPGQYMTPGAPFSQTPAYSGGALPEPQAVTMPSPSIVPSPTPQAPPSAGNVAPGMMTAPVPGITVPNPAGGPPGMLQPDGAGQAPAAPKPAGENPAAPATKPGAAVPGAATPGTVTPPGPIKKDPAGKG